MKAIVLREYSGPRFIPSPVELQAARGLSSTSRRLLVAAGLVVLAGLVAWVGLA